MGLMLAGCSAEDQCTKRLPELEAQHHHWHSVDNGRLKFETPVVEAGMLLNNAQVQKATGNFEGCVESLKAARAELRKMR
jgi:hypothetical protein